MTARAKSTLMLATLQLLVCPVVLWGIDQHNYKKLQSKYPIHSRCCYMYLRYHAIFIMNVWNVHGNQSHQLKEPPLRLRTLIASTLGLICTEKAPTKRTADQPPFACCEENKGHT